MSLSLGVAFLGLMWTGLPVPSQSSAPPSFHAALPSSMGPRVVLVTLPAPQPSTQVEGTLAVEQVDDPLVIYLEPVDASADSTELDEHEPTSCAFRSTLRSLGRWLVVLISMVFVVALLGSVGASRRPLPLAAMAVRQPSRPVPLVERLLVLCCLWSPMLMLLSLLQAEREMLSSVLLCMAVTGVASAGSMLSSRRRLLAQLRWAFGGDGTRLRDQPTGTVVRAEVTPRRMAPPPGATAPVPWFAADLVVECTDGNGPRETARVALDGAVVDEAAARAMVRMAMGLPADVQLTILGPTAPTPADADAVDALDRSAPIQARIGGIESHGAALVIAGSVADLRRRLRTESILLTGALAASLAAALIVVI